MQFNVKIVLRIRINIEISKYMYLFINIKALFVKVCNKKLRRLSRLFSCQRTFNKITNIDFEY